MAKLENLPEAGEFPQLREIADPEKLAQTLQRHIALTLASDEVQVDACTMDQLRYNPGSDCRILFTADLRHDGTRGRQIFFGRLFPSPRAAEAFASLDRANLAPPEFGPAVIHIPEWEMVVWAYPNDPNLPGLSLMVNDEKILALAQAAPEKFGLSQPPATVTAKMTKYVPGMRCGYIYQMRLASPDSPADNRARAVYGKAYREKEGEKAYVIMKQIWESAACRQGDLILPQPYSYDPETQIIWQEALAGKPFAKIAETIPDLPAVAEEIGGRLAAFHGLHLDLPVEMTFDLQVEELRQSVLAISQAFPEHAPRCAALAQKLLDAADKLGPGPLTPVHASFKFSHIFATAKGVAFIDFDGANLGDPGYDLGRFIAHLYKMETSGKIAPEVAKQTVANFCAAYRRAAASPLRQQRIDWFAASHLISSQMYKSVKRMDPRAMNKLLEFAERLCA